MTEVAGSQSSVSIKTTAKGQKQVDVKVYQDPEIGVDLASEAVTLMQRTEAECIEAGYELAGS